MSEVVVVERVVVDMTEHRTSTEEGVAGLVEVRAERVDQGRGLTLGVEDDRGLYV